MKVEEVTVILEDGQSYLVNIKDIVFPTLLNEYREDILKAVIYNISDNLPAVIDSIEIVATGEPVNYVNLEPYIKESTTVKGLTNLLMELDCNLKSLSEKIVARPEYLTNGASWDQKKHHAEQIGKYIASADLEEQFLEQLEAARRRFVGFIKRYQSCDDVHIEDDEIGMVDYSACRYACDMYNIE
jgi:hypothetical protein